MAEILNLQQLPDSVRTPVESYASKLISTHQDNVVALAVYGSAAGRNFIPKVSDVNLAMVLKVLNFDVLKRSLRIVKEGRPHRIQAPLLLTMDYIDRSLDVFPVEFLNLKENSILLYGEDVFGRLKVDDKYLKLFCEQQIKGHLLRLRQSYLEVGGQDKVKERLLKDSVTHLMPVFRNLLRLAGQPLPELKEDILKVMASSYHVNAGTLLAIYRDHTGDEEIAGRDVDQVLEKYFDILEQLALKVD